MAFVMVVRPVGRYSLVLVLPCLFRIVFGGYHVAKNAIVSGASGVHVPVDGAATASL